MKNRINYKPILAFTFGLAGTLILMSSCSENRRTDTIAEKENLDNLAADDKTIVVIENDNGSKFLIEVAEMQMQEIRLGRLAQQKGTSSHVKELGKMMEEGHTKTLAELEALAQANAISIPTTTTTSSEGDYEDLNKLTGVDFGKAYSDMMVEHHEDAIDLFEKASADSENEQIRTWATNQLPTLRTHLEHSKACKLECDKM